MNVFLRLNINVLNYFLIYVRMPVMLNLSFENESCDYHTRISKKFIFRNPCYHMRVRAKARLCKSCVLSFTSEKRVLSDDEVGYRCKIVIDVECMDLHSEAA